MKTNSRIIFTAALLSLLLASPAIFAGKVYKWVDKDGNVHYSAQKPMSGAQEMKVKVRPSSSADNSETTAESSSATKQEAQEETIKVSSEKEAAEIEKRNAEIRKKNCSVAKKRLATIKVGGRLFEVDEKGERHYWDDATRASKLSEAQAQVQEWCKE